MGIGERGLSTDQAGVKKKKWGNQNHPRLGGGEAMGKEGWEGQ